MGPQEQARIAVFNEGNFLRPKKAPLKEPSLMFPI
jgi:hypothetical protein